MNVNDLENKMNSFELGNLGESLGNIFTLELQNNALLRTILINQAKEKALIDSSKTSLEYEKEFLELANKLQHEKMADLLSKKKEK